MINAENKAVFLDRDGTLVRDYGYNCDIDKIEILPDAVSALKILQSRGYLLIVVTNQSGVARGYFSEEQLKKFNAALTEKFKNEGVNIAATYYCPHYERGVVLKYAVKCDCRKPDTGMFFTAARDFSLDISKCWNIGDSLRDCSISDTTGCKSFLLSGKPHALQTENKNIYVASGWRDIIELIERGVLH